MKPDVLDHNLRLLLRRSYVPALPAPHFRDRLESTFLAEIERLAAERRPRERARARGAPRIRLVLALAAALLAVLVGWRFVAGGAASAGERLVARGEVALGFPDGLWRAADDEERVHGHAFASATLVALTPAGVEFELLAAGGRVHLGERSELQLARAGEEIALTLQRGSAWFEVAGEHRALAPGEPVSLREPEQAAAPALASTARTEPRVALPAEPAPAAVTPPDAPAARVFAGHVTVLASGAAVTTFSVALLPERRGHQTFPPTVRAFTSSEGFFAWEDPPRGKQRVFVHAEGHALRALGEFDFSGPPPELLVELEPGASVRGSVLDRQGNPIADALVFSENDAPTDGLLFAQSEYAFWLPIQTRSGRDGRFELAHLTPGVHSLRADAAGFAVSWVDGVAVPGAPGAELTIALGHGGTIAGRAEGDDGSAWAGAQVVAVAMDDVQRARQNFALTRTDSEGRYRFDNLPSVTVLVVMLRADGRPDVRPVQVIEDGSVRVDFLATPLGIRLHGRLLDQSGAPCPLRNLGLFDAQTASWNQDWVASTTDSGGAYAFEGVRPGRYALYLVDDLGRGLRCVDELELLPGVLEREHDVVVPAGRFDVVVRAAESGAPVEQSALIVMRLEDGGGETFAAFGQTDAQGRAAFVEQRPGRYYVLAYPQVDGLGFTRSETVEVSAERGAELEILHEAGGALDVIVRASDGRPLEGATVVFHDAQGAEHLFSRLPLTDASGRYHAQGLLPGSYRVHVELEGYQSSTSSFELLLGRELELPIVLAPLPPR